MSIPRVFISSTYYDLMQIRADIEIFIKDFGFEPVLHEKGNIPYGKKNALEDYCCKEIENCDIVIAIIGGRYGAQSKSGEYSITQKEIMHAIDLKKQVQFFVEKCIWTELGIYTMNPGKDDIRYRYTENPLKVFGFIEWVKGLSKNNPICQFENASDITSFLKKQWIGQFKIFLQQEVDSEVRADGLDLVKELSANVDALNQVVQFMKEKFIGQSTAIQNSINPEQVIGDIVLSNHPAMEQIRKIFGIKCRVYFSIKKELEDWLEYMKYIKVETSDTYDEWSRIRAGKKSTIRINNSMFDSMDRLIDISKNDWEKGKQISYRYEDLKEDDDDLNIILDRIGNPEAK